MQEMGKCDFSAKTFIHQENISENVILSNYAFINSLGKYFNSFELSFIWE